MKTKILFVSIFCLVFCNVVFAQEVFKNADLTISKLDQGVWVVETADMTTMYIIEGEERAMLIDTGTQCEALDETIRKITDKPLYVVITHNHGDHSGNIRYFDEVYMHPLDTVIPVKIPFTGKYNWINDGDVFDLGGRIIEAIWLPGHTPGSIVLLDKTIGVCYTGDTFGSGQVWLQLMPHLPMSTYYKSCIRMEEIMKEQHITKVYCGHYPYLKRALDLNYIADMKELAKKLIDGDTSSSKPYDRKVGIVEKPAFVQKGDAVIVYDSENIN
jgi:glyoxylase-like metal-dependent hydrolase (beta-lactamase superfamily II)